MNRFYYKIGTNFVTNIAIIPTIPTVTFLTTCRIIYRLQSQNKKKYPLGLQPVIHNFTQVQEKQSHNRPDRPRGFQEGEAPRFQDNRHIKVGRLSALRTGHLYLQEIYLILISVRDWVNRSHSAAERIMLMKNSSETIGNRTRALPTCRAVPQPTALPRAPFTISYTGAAKKMYTHFNERKLYVV